MATSMGTVLTALSKSFAIKSTLPVCFTAITLAIFPFTMVAGEQLKTMSNELAAQLQKDKFKDVKAVADLPASVKSYYTKQSNADDINKVMADAGKDFQSGCVRTPGGGPSKSFTLGAKSADLCIVYYESGGFVLLDAIDVFKLSENSAEKVWSSSMFKDHPKTVEQLVEAVKERVNNPIK